MDRKAIVEDIGLMEALAANSSPVVSTVNANRYRTRYWPVLFGVAVDPGIIVHYGVIVC